MLVNVWVVEDVSLNGADTESIFNNAVLSLDENGNVVFNSAKGRNLYNAHYTVDNNYILFYNNAGQVQMKLKLVEVTPNNLVIEKQQKNLTTTLYLSSE